MAPQSPSIQSFFQPETPYIQPAVSDKNVTGDEFTTTEANPLLYSSPHAWRPRTQYKDARIGSLVPGPKCVHLVGRVVNFYDQPTPTSKLPYATKRCLNVLVRDDTGMIKEEKLLDAPLGHGSSFLLLSHYYTNFDRRQQWATKPLPQS
ncbi:MAG: hypothetical protein Q9178_003244 [Gyalolechia marmorata]